jgi:KDO2-lipid IV(A) lauroyltransferase
MTAIPGLPVSVLFCALSSGETDPIIYMDKTVASKLKNKPVWHPLLWPTWIIVFILFSLSLLPMTTKQKLGVKIGRFAKAKMKSRTKVTRKNIEVCFPELSEEAREKLVEDAYIACARGFLESTHAWWRDVTPYVKTLKIKGEEHLKEAQARGKGIFLIGGHYSIFDFALPLFAYQLVKPGYMYRPNDNPVVDRMIENGRRRHCGIQGFSKFEMNEMIAFLKGGGSVWYACDQDFGQKSRVFVPFFGVKAGCITMPSLIAKRSGASIICVSHLRHPNGQYEVTFSPIQEGFGEDEEKDTLAWNNYLENALRQHPEQYLWMHKRFKTRPQGEPPIY